MMAGAPSIYNAKKVAVRRNFAVRRFGSVWYLLRQLRPLFLLQNRRELSKQARAVAAVGAPVLTCERFGIERREALQDLARLRGVGVVVHRFPHRFAGGEDF